MTAQSVMTFLLMFNEDGVTKDQEAEPLVHEKTTLPMRPIKKHLKKLTAFLLPIAFSAWCLSSLTAAERRIVLKSDTSDYELIYDDRRTGDYDMEQIVWLSPWYNPDQAGPYETGFSIDEQGVDKVFLVPQLERGAPSEEVPHELTFSTWAEKNLAYGKQEITTFKAAKLPGALEPVRSYLMENLEFFEAVAQLRYGYIKSGDVRPLSRALCAACICQQEQNDILEQLKSPPDFESRVRASSSNWPNEMLKCHRTRVGRYPISAWETFKQKFGIRESHREKSPE